MTRRHTRFLACLAAVLLACTFAAAPAAAKDDCTVTAADKDDPSLEIAKGWLPIGLGLVLAEKICQGGEYLKKVFSSGKPPEDITPEDVFEASTPDIETKPTALQNAVKQNSAAEWLKAREEEKQAAYLRSNPADEAVAEANRREEEARLNGTPPPAGEGPAPGSFTDTFENGGKQPTPASGAGGMQGSDGEQPATVEDEGAQNYIVLPPDDPDGSVRLFSGTRADTGEPDTTPNMWKAFNGEGVMLSEDGMAAGTFEEGQLQGEGEEITGDGTWRVGQFDDGKMQGAGFEVGENEDGQEYTLMGNFVDDKPNGQALLTYEDGSSQNQLWRGGQVVSEGTIAPAGQTALAADDPDGTYSKGDKFKTGPNNTLEVVTIGDKTYLVNEYWDGKRDGMMQRVFADGTVQFEDWEGGKMLQTGTRGTYADTIAPQTVQRPVQPAPRAAAYTPPPASGGGGDAKFSSTCMRNFQKIQDREVAILQGFPTGQNGDVAQVRHARTAMFAQCMAYDPQARDNYNESLDDERSWQDEVCRPNPSLCQDFFPDVTRAILAEFQRAMNDPNYSAEYGSAGGSGGGSARAAPPAPPPPAASYIGEFNVANPVMPQSFYAQHSGRGMSPDVLEQQQNTDPLLNRLAGLMNGASDNHQRMKYLIATLEGLIVIYRQAADVPGGREQIQGWIQSRDDTIRACQQTSSDPADCTAPVQ